MQKQLESKGGTILAVSSDKPSDSKKFKKQNGFAFDLLGDQDAKVIKSLGLLFHEPFHDLDVALPANFLIDREGKIAWKWIAPRVQDRADPGLVAEEVEKLVGRIE